MRQQVLLFQWLVHFTWYNVYKQEYSCHDGKEILKKYSGDLIVPNVTKEDYARLSWYQWCRTPKMRVNSKLLLSSSVNSLSIVLISGNSGFLAPFSREGNWTRFLFLTPVHIADAISKINSFVTEWNGGQSVVGLAIKISLTSFASESSWINIDLWNQSLLTLHKAPVILLTWDRGRLLNETCQIAVCCFVNFFISTVLNDILLNVIAFVEIFLC